MQQLKLFFLPLLLFLIKTCYSLTCSEAEKILNIQILDFCCNLEPFTCDDNNNILSIDIFSLSNQLNVKKENDLFSRGITSGYLNAKKNNKKKEEEQKNNNSTDTENTSDGIKSFDNCVSLLIIFLTLNILLF